MFFRRNPGFFMPEDGDDRARWPEDVVIEWQTPKEEYAAIDWRAPAGNAPGMHRDEPRYL